LLRAGRITEQQAHGHPMRNYVECCIGGDPVLPEMTLSGRRALLPGDVLMLCSDGLWSGLSEDLLGSLGRDPKANLRESLTALGEQAIFNSAPYADNTSAAAIRWLGP
jgi:serine/threonine protein phosphatase PrpC